MSEKEYEIQQSLSKINNTGYRIKINYQFRDGKCFLFLNYRKMVNGKSLQETKRIGMLRGEKKYDLEIINKAMLIRNEFENSIKSDFNLLKNNTSLFRSQDEIIFINDYIDLICSRYSKKQSTGKLITLKKYITQFSGKSTTLSQIDKNYCLKFKEYLSQNIKKSSKCYFSRFKLVLYRAIEDEIISEMPFLRFMSIKAHEPQIEYLTFEEINKLYSVSTKYEHHKNAFIFGCYTGLRFGDLLKLRYSDIYEDVLRIVMQKTHDYFELKLHSVALEIIEKQKILQQQEKQKRQEQIDKLILLKSTNKISEEIFNQRLKKLQLDENLVFNITSYQCWKDYIPRIIKQAGITKRITGHCARHTFGTLCAYYDGNISVLQKNMGHKDINTTMRYVKVIDTARREAIDKLPSLTPPDSES